MFKDDYGKKVKKIGLIVIDNPLRELEGNKNLIE